MKQIIRISYDSQPDDIAEAFIQILIKAGIKVNMLPPNEGDVFHDYEIEFPEERK